MHEQDFKEFGALLDGVCSLLTRGSYTPSATNTAMFFRALERHDIGTVRAAFSAHVKDPVRGKFAPVPADILAQIDGMFAASDGRPGVEEAWAAIPTDESATVIWSSEAEQAYGACAPLLNAGDRVAARMAFKEVYARLIAAARDEGQPVKWIISLGHDIEQRKRVLAAGVEALQLSAEQAYELCPALPAPASLLLEAPLKNEREATKARRKLAELVEAKRDAGGQVDPMAWAHALRERERTGKTLSEAQRTAWRVSIDRRPAAEPMGTFTPIPNDALPPGMRKHNP